MREIQDGESEIGVEAEWSEEIARRAIRVLSGESEGEDWEEVRDRIAREILRP